MTSLEAPLPIMDKVRYIISHIGVGEVLLVTILLLFFGELVAAAIYRVSLAILGSSSSSSLKIATNEIRRGEIGFVLIVLAARQFGQSLGIWPCHEIVDAGTSDASVSKGRKKAASTGPRLIIKGPQLSTSMPLKIKKEDVIAFHKAIDNYELDISSSDSLTMLFLSAVSEPAQLLLLAKRQCPIKPLGAVNVCNRFELIKPERCRALCEGMVKESSVKAWMSEDVRPRKRGLEFDLVVEVYAAETNEVGAKILDKAVFRQVFTVLQFQKHTYSIAADAQTDGDDPTSEPVTIGAPLNMGSKEPSVWASLCMDYNPIHISGLAAKMFGLPGKIAHGNHVAAKAIALVNRGTPEVPDRDRASSATMSVSFKKPVKVPTQLQVTVASQGDSKVFRILRADKIHVECRIVQA